MPRQCSRNSLNTWTQNPQTWKLVAWKDTLPSEDEQGWKRGLKNKNEDRAEAQNETGSQMCKPLILEHRRQKQADLWEFAASLVYVESPRAARDAQ